jgi:Flp pilus assembly protein TadG
MLRRKKTQRGSVFVEAALISLVLMLMMLGIFDFGQMLFRHQALVERARRTVRWGAIYNASDTTAIRNKFLYGQPTVPSGASGYLGLTASNVTVTRDGTPLTDNDRLTLTIVNQPFRMISPYIAGVRTGQPIQVSVPLGMFN